MDKVILIRFGELYLKGKNRRFFENILINNIKRVLKKFDCKAEFGRNRYVVSEFSNENTNNICDALTKVFGLHSISVASVCSTDMSEIMRTCENLVNESGSFKVDTNRGDKNFYLTSPEISRQVGGYLLTKFPSLSVDIHNPDFVVNIDLREDGKTYVYRDRILCVGGMPVSSAGKGLLLLSGGIDSPVAGYMMAKRGLCFDAIHFHSYPYTSENAKQKVVELAHRLSEYTGKFNLICIPFTSIQENIHKHCDSNYMITIVRRMMMVISEKVAALRNCGCLINGESLGQVASQTLESITVTNDMVKTMPIFRPLIGMDKQEIIDISLKMDTYNTSILPYEDCCTVFLPDSPVTRPTLNKAAREQNKIPDLDKLISEAIDNAEIIPISNE